MFPENTLREEIENYSATLGEQNRQLGVTPAFNYEKSEIILANSTPKLVTDIEAIKQWIILFVTTPRDVYKIYEGTDFGTSYKKLYGEKFINNGYAESELEREITEGLLLNPAINSVESVEITKKGKKLNVKVSVQLWDGDLLETLIEEIITIK